MPTRAPVAGRTGEDDLRAEIQSRPQLLLRLAENALTVAEGLRDDYLARTARFVAALRKAATDPTRRDPPLRVAEVGPVGWDEHRGELAAFIDGGVGTVRVSGRAPILVRVGAYTVRVGERRLADREQFAYYPLILGDLEGGSKHRAGFIDLVRIAAELLGGLAALRRHPDLRVLMFHGPLAHPIGLHAGHTPFTERDVDLFLRSYDLDAAAGRDLKEGFLREARDHVYPRMTGSADWADRRVFEPLAWVAYLGRRLVAIAAARDPRPLIAGVVERGGLSDYARTVLLARVFDGLRAKGHADYFNQLFGRRDLGSPAALVDRLGYNDAMLLALLLRPGQYTEPWPIERFDDLRPMAVRLPDSPGVVSVDYSALRPGPLGSPRVLGSYLMVSESTDPLRVETFDDLGADQVDRAARRACLYARLLPGYGYPVGLDVADKLARVPAWLTDAYGKLIRYHLAAGLARGEVGDAELRRALLQAIYVTHRDWLFRPTV